MKHCGSLLLTVVVVVFLGCGRSEDFQGEYDAYLAEMGADNDAVVPLIEDFVDVIKELRRVDPSTVPVSADELIIEAGDYIEQNRRLKAAGEGVESDFEPLQVFESAKQEILTGFDDLLDGYITFIENFDYSQANEDAIPGMHELKLATYCGKLIEEAERLERRFSEAERNLRSALLDEGVEP